MINQIKSMVLGVMILAGYCFLMMIMQYILPLLILYIFITYIVIYVKFIIEEFPFNFTKYTPNKRYQFKNIKIHLLPRKKGYNFIINQ